MTDQSDRSRARGHAGSARTASANKCTQDPDCPAPTSPAASSSREDDGPYYASMITAIRNEYEAIILDLLEELERRPARE